PVLRLAGPLAERRGHAVAEEQDLALLARLPPGGPLLPGPLALLLRLDPPLARRLHAPLEHLRLGLLDVAQAQPVCRERRDLALELADPAELLGRIVGGGAGLGPEAHPDHLLEDHLVLARRADPVVQLLARGRAGPRTDRVSHGHPRRKKRRRNAAAR